MNKVDFSNFVKDKRKELNMTQEELADKLFVSRKVVSKWENGVRYPDAETLQMLAQALQVTPNELFEQSSINDDKHSFNPAVIIAPLVILLTLVGFIIVPLTLRENNISNADNIDTENYRFELKDGKLVGIGNLDTTEYSTSYMEEFYIESHIEDGRKEKIMTVLQSFIGNAVDEDYEDYEFLNYDYIIYYYLGDIELRNRTEFKINLETNHVWVKLPGGKTAILKCEEIDIGEARQVMYMHPASEHWASDPELYALYKKYPDYFNCNRGCGYTIYVWQVGPDEYKCGITTQPALTGEDIIIATVGIDDKIFDKYRVENQYQIIQLNKGTSVDEMKKIMTRYDDITDTNVYVVGAYNPIAGYEYELDGEFQQRVRALFGK